VNTIHKTYEFIKAGYVLHKGISTVDNTGISTVDNTEEYQLYSERYNTMKIMLSMLKHYTNYGFHELF
jgi:hypothetical protein